MADAASPPRRGPRPPLTDLSSVDRGPLSRVPGLHLSSESRRLPEPVDQLLDLLRDLGNAGGSRLKARGIVPRLEAAPALLPFGDRYHMAHTGYCVIRGSG